MNLWGGERTSDHGARGNEGLRCQPKGCAEGEAPSAWECVRLLGDRAAGILDGGEGGIEVDGVEQDERSTGLDVGAETETADLAVTLGCLDAGVGRRIVGEPPVEGRGVKCWAASISVTVIST
jgi:hypothetical protein